MNKELSVMDIPNYQSKRMSNEHQVLQLFRDPEFYLEHLDSGKRYAMFHRFTLIGNDANLPICIKDPSVSPEHACIEVEDSRPYLIDKGAINGCYINDQRMMVNGKKRIVHGDILRFGNAEDSYKFVSNSQDRQEAEDGG